MEIYKKLGIYCLLTLNTIVRLFWFLLRSPLWILSKKEFELKGLGKEVNSKEL